MVGKLFKLFDLQFGRSLSPQFALAREVVKGEGMRGTALFESRLGWWQCWLAALSATKASRR
jgi:hypothetical protein